MLPAPWAPLRNIQALVAPRGAGWTKLARNALIYAEMLTGMFFNGYVEKNSN